MKSTLMALVAIAAVTMLTSCIDAPPPPKTQRMTFDNIKPILVDAARVDIMNNYKSPIKAPNIEHILPNPPAIAAETMLNRQIAATGPGSNNVLRVMIVDAPVLEEKLPLTKGVKGAFTKEASAKLSARLLIKFELATLAAPDIIIGHADVSAARTKYVMKGASPAEREQVYDALVREMLKDVEGGVKSAVESTFGKKY